MLTLYYFTFFAAFFIFSRILRVTFIVVINAQTTLPSLPNEWNLSNFFLENRKKQTFVQALHYRIPNRGQILVINTANLKKNTFSSTADIFPARKTRITKILKLCKATFSTFFKLQHNNFQVPQTVAGWLTNLKAIANTFSTCLTTVSKHLKSNIPSSNPRTHFGNSKCYLADLSVPGKNYVVFPLMLPPLTEMNAMTFY